MLILTAHAQDQADLPVLTMEGDRILMNGDRARIWTIRKYLVVDRGSRPAALKAKRTGAAGVGLLVAGGAAMMAGGSWALFDEQQPTPGRITFLAGTGVLLTGGVLRLRSFPLWRRAVRDYEGPEPATTP